MQTTTLTPEELLKLKQMKSVGVARLTNEEMSLAASVIEKVIDCLEFDDITETYTDGGRFLLSLEVSELKTLSDAQAKLLLKGL